MIKSIGILAIAAVAGAAAITAAPPAQANHEVQLNVFLANVNEFKRKKVTQVPVTVYLEVKGKRSNETVCRVSPRARDAALGHFNKTIYKLSRKGNLDVKKIQKDLKPKVVKAMGRFKSMLKNVRVKQGPPHIPTGAASSFARQGCMTATHQEEIDRQKAEKKRKAEEKKRKERAKKAKKAGS